MTITGAALAAAGCGGSPSADPATTPADAGAPTQVELTDGRLGGAVDQRMGGTQRELAPDGPLDARKRPQPDLRDGVGAGDACAGQVAVPAAATLAAVTDTTLCLLNGARADRGLVPLTVNARLTAAAGVYAQDLVAGSYFSHTGRDGSSVHDRIDRAGYLPASGRWRIGENLAWGSGGLAAPGSIMQAWMNSTGHRENILNPAFREIGIGIVTGNPAKSDGAGATYATSFGAIEGADAVTVAGAPRAGSDGKPSARARARARRARKRARRAARARTAREAQAAGASEPGR